MICALAASLLALPALAQETNPLAPYPSCEEVLTEIRDLAAAHPDRVALEEIGQSVAGRPIPALHFHLGQLNCSGTDRNVCPPQALITAGIHAQEFIGTEVALAAARLLAQGDADQLLAGSDVWVVPLLNVDGHCQVYDDQGKGNKITKGRKNLHGVDLNRNFPEAAGAKSRHPLAGNRRPGSSYYMGPKALSEPETRAIADLVAAHPFYAAIALHSVAGKYLYPFCYTRAPAPEAEWFQMIGQALIEHQPHHAYRVQQSYSWYPTLGDLDDFLYIQYGILSATVEVGTVGQNLPHFFRTFKFFWISNPQNVSYWTGNDAGAILAGLDRARELTSGRPLPPGAKPGRPESQVIIYPRTPVP
ncbi:MAG: hypothetical protein A2V67_06615 [Deltaproteobacteria bacterium RBG_13_61_14]|nr:MAG: hypothetical protein A2V67_06615 [Deltaproteobacteria bacterium RBG_13_61_14]